MESMEEKKTSEKKETAKRISAQNRQEIRRSQLKKEVSGELTGAKLFIEYPDYYEEDYQVMMLRKNQIPHLLRPQLDGIGHCSRFSYEIQGKLSMRSLFEKKNISC